MQYTIFLLLAPLAAVLSIGVIVYASRYRTASDTPALIWLTVSAVGWLLCDAAELMAKTPVFTVFWAKVAYLFIVIVPVAWLFFAMEYSQAWTWLRYRRSWIFFVIPAITLLLVFTNGRHGLVWQAYDLVPAERWLRLHVDHGPWFWIHTAYSYALFLSGSRLLIRRYMSAQPLYRSQSSWLVLGSIIPIAFNLIYIFHLVPSLQKDFTAVGLAISGVVFAAGMLQHQLFDLRPIARAALIDSMRDVMITVDDANRVVDYNPAARNLLVRLVGGLDEDTLLGANLTDLVGPWPDLLTCLTSTHLSERDIELRLADERYYYECRVVAIGGPRARDLARLVVLHDITERKEAEATLRDSMLELQSTNEQLDAFAHTVAHDLKDPLNTLTGYAQLLEAYWNKLPQEDIEVYLASIRQTGTQMTRIIDALLLLSRTYRLEDVALEAVDMEAVVAEAVHRVSAAVNTQDIQLVMPERWPWVMGYAPWIVEVWANYLSNAIKYGGERRRVALGFEDATAPGSNGEDRGEAAGGQIRFWVHDDGPGLTSVQQAHLFRPFVRFHPSRGDGTGLGLTIVQRIIEKLGGHVGVKSEPGHGSTFWFTLPDLGAGSESSN